MFQQFMHCVPVDAQDEALKKQKTYLILTSQCQISI